MADCENKETSKKKGKRRQDDSEEESDEDSSTDAQSNASSESFDKNMVNLLACVKSKNNMPGLFVGT